MAIDTTEDETASNQAGIDVRGERRRKGGLSITRRSKLYLHSEFDDLHSLLLDSVDVDQRSKWETILFLLRDTYLRQSEVLGLAVDQIPSAEALRRLQAASGPDAASATVSIPGGRSGIRGSGVALTVAALERLRDYIDRERPRHVLAGVDTPAIFLAERTGVAMRPESLTNLYRGAARLLAVKANDEDGGWQLARMRPRHLRERRLADLARHCLQAGMDANDALLTVMTEAKIKSVKLAVRYLQLAAAEMAFAPTTPRERWRPSDARGVADKGAG